MGGRLEKMVGVRAGGGGKGREEKSRGETRSLGFEGAVLDRDGDGRGMGAQEEWIGSEWVEWVE
jgi:hypothetical protein